MFGKLDYVKYHGGCNRFGLLGHLTEMCKEEVACLQ